MRPAPIWVLVLSMLAPGANAQDGAIQRALIERDPRIPHKLLKSGPI
jgi:hypothetical protein